MNLEDKALRMRLLESFFAAETTVEEERLLAAFYREHITELAADERAMAEVLIFSMPEEELMSDEEMNQWEVDSQEAAGWKRSTSPILASAYKALRGVAAIALLLVVGMGYRYLTNREYATPQRLASNQATIKPSHTTSEGKNTNKTQTSVLSPICKEDETKDQKGRQRKTVKETARTRDKKEKREGKTATAHSAIEVEIIQQCMALMKDCDDLLLVNSKDSVYIVATQSSGNQTIFSVCLPPNGDSMLLSAIQ